MRIQTIETGRLDTRARVTKSSSLVKATAAAASVFFKLLHQERAANRLHEHEQHRSLAPATTARRRVAVVHPRGFSSGLEHDAIGPAGSVKQRGFDVIGLQIREVGQNFLGLGAIGQHFENVLHADAKAANAGASAALARFHRDAFHQLHAPFSACRNTESQCRDCS